MDCSIARNAFEIRGVYVGIHGLAILLWIFVIVGHGPKVNYQTGFSSDAHFGVPHIPSYHRKLQIFF
jgi:hypothetical protein